MPYGDEEPRPSAVSEVTGGYCSVRNLGEPPLEPGEEYGENWPYSVAVYFNSPGVAPVNLSGTLVVPNRNCALWRDLTNTLFLAGEIWTHVFVPTFPVGSILTKQLFNAQYISKSVDWGVTWSLMTAIYSSGYEWAHSCPLLPVGGASIANKTGTAPIEVYIKTTDILSAWPADGAALLVGTYSGTVEQFHVMQTRDGTGKLVVSNGIDAAWESSDKGLTWTDL